MSCVSPRSILNIDGLRGPIARFTVSDMAVHTADRFLVPNALWTGVRAIGVNLHVSATSPEVALVTDFRDRLVEKRHCRLENMP
jgi:hypothetical protein